MYFYVLPTAITVLFHRQEWLYPSILDTTPQKRVPVCWEQSVPASPFGSNPQSINARTPKHAKAARSSLRFDSEVRGKACVPELLTFRLRALIHYGGNLAYRSRRDNYFYQSAGIRIRDLQFAAKLARSLLDTTNSDAKAARMEFRDLSADSAAIVLDCDHSLHATLSERNPDLCSASMPENVRERFLDNSEDSCFQIGR